MLPHRDTCFLQRGSTQAGPRVVRNRRNMHPVSGLSPRYQRDRSRQNSRSALSLEPHQSPAGRTGTAIRRHPPTQGRAAPSRCCRGDG
ncbi:hypothetical protein G6F65_022781 [Rhizopus arrhizus]|nr:hypothetical protein G6F65_022781 [Rhizopus arrhizus]